MPPLMAGAEDGSGGADAFIGLLVMSCCLLTPALFLITLLIVVLVRWNNRHDE